MHRILRKDQVLTLPNLLSLVRLLLIPLILWMYFEKGNHLMAVSLVVLSGITDIVDGYIARNFNMVSDLGKILDPAADKLTQLALICCFLSEYKWMLPLMVLFIAKELLMAIAGFIALQKKDSVNSAQWFGKLNTAVLYAVMILFFLNPAMSQTAANALILLCAATNLLALIKYLLFYNRLLANKNG